MLSSQVVNSAEWRCRYDTGATHNVSWRGAEPRDRPVKQVARWRRWRRTMRASSRCLAFPGRCGSSWHPAGHRMDIEGRAFCAEGAATCQGDGDPRIRLRRLQGRPSEERRWRWRCVCRIRPGKGGLDHRIESGWANIPSAWVLGGAATFAHSSLHKYAAAARWQS